MNQSLLLLVAVAFCLQAFTSLKTVYAARESTSDSDSDSGSISVSFSDSESDESANFKVHISKMEENGKCVTKYLVKGEVIDDTFTRDCYDDELEVVKDDDNDLLIVGDLKAKPFTLYSKKPDTLAIIEDGKCTRKLYSGYTKKIISKKLSSSECKIIKKTIQTELRKRKKGESKKTTASETNKGGTSNSNIKPGPGSQNFNGAVIKGVGNMKIGKGISIGTARYKKKGKCEETITVVGKDFEDKFIQKCAEDGLLVLHSKVSFIIGIPDRDPVSLFSDNPQESSLTIIRDKACTKRTYLDDNAEGFEDSVIKQSKCEEITKKIQSAYEEYEESRKYWEQWQSKFDKKTGNKKK